MGVMDKFLNYMKLNGEDDDYYDEEDDYGDDGYEAEPVKKPVPMKKVMEDEDDKPSRKGAAPKASPSKKISKLNGTGMEVCVIKPTTVEDAREITETLLSNRTVVLNMEGLDVDIAQRIIDFTSGSTFAISGNLQKISHYIFIITPPSVDISGDFQELLSDSFDVQSMHG
ncbi:MAG: cell division protein SepF [Lachnospiraceae bacterium]|nr:cell division protein SepF [Lachnospiraceae bacterium]